jgi:hypothetical protein
LRVAKGGEQELGGLDGGQVGLDEAAEFVRKIHVFHERWSSTGSAFRLSVVNDNRPM